MTEQLVRSMKEILREPVLELPRRLHRFGRVPSQLRDKTDDWHPFDPKFVSIGPLHMGMPNLEGMHQPEQRQVAKLKWESLARLLRQHPVRDIDVLYPCVENCVSAVRGLEESARGKYYPEEFPQLDKDEFTKMLVLDACFLILCCCYQHHGDDDIDNNFFSEFGEHISREVLLHDFLLIENQIPFDVLKAVYHSVFPYDEPKELVVRLRMFFFPNEVFNDSSERTDYVNFLQLYCENLCHVEIHYQQSNMAKLKNYVWYPYKFFLKKLFRDQNDVVLPTKVKKTSTAAECVESGIHIKATDRRSCIPYIMFTNGTLTIQHIHMNQLTYSRLRNIILYEESRRVVLFHNLESRIIMSDYVRFLCSLVQSEADYKVLEKKGVVSADSREDGLLMFRKLKTLHFLKLSPSGRPAARDIRDSIEKYVAEPHHRWRVNLVRDYFSSPWSVIGLVVSFILLTLSVLQTLYTVLGYYNNKN